MKKYQQFILVVLSILSLVSLLFYRHEYNKLRYVLEVLNFFGTPGISTSATSSCAQNISVERQMMSEPLPAWQRVSNTLYIYSAYWETLDDKGHVKALAIGELNENLKYGCYVWYDMQPDAIKGQFSFSGIAGKNQEAPLKNSIGSKYFNKQRKMKGFMFYCGIDSANMVPIGVTFHKKGNEDSSQAFIPVTNVNVNQPVQNSTAACVLPLEYPSWQKSQYLEFLSFHKAVGVNDFIIYGGNVQHHVVSPILKDVSYDINLIMLQWNYPFVGDPDLVKLIAENDCILRTRGYFENVAVIKWNQFLVPQYHSNINNILLDYDPDRKTQKFVFPTLLFCSEYKDDVKSDLSLPLVFRKTRFAMAKGDTSVAVFRPQLTTGLSLKVNKDTANVHWYTNCDGFDLKSPDKTSKKLDYSILRFKEELMQSRLLKL